MRHTFAKSLLLVVITALVTAAVMLLPTLADRGPATELSIAAAPTAPPADPPVAEVEPTATPTPIETTDPIGVPVMASAPVLEIPDERPTPLPTASPGATDEETTVDPGQGDGERVEEGGEETAEPEAAPAPSTATAPTAEPAATATPEPTATPAPTATPEPTATPAPTATPMPEPTATPLPLPAATPIPQPTATPTPDPVQAVESAWLYVDSLEGLLLRADPGGSVLRALAHRAQVFATGTIAEWGGREWMQIESPARGWAARDYLTDVQPEAPVVVTPEPSGEPPTEADWEALRQCESSGRYTVISPNGLYHGAYQFLPSTWDSIAGRAGRADLIGVLPSQAAPADQDAMALYLYSLQGASPWPHCGQALL